MNLIRSPSWAVAVWLLFLPAAPAQETVTIPKARLQELERKEKQLEALQAELGRTRGEKEKLQREKEKAEGDRARFEKEKAQLTKAKEAAEAVAAAAKVEAARAEPAIEHHTPALATLPPLKRDDVVDAMDLMNHYRKESDAAARRFGGKRICVRGVVVGLEKNLFLSSYDILLQTTERPWKLVCSVQPPDEFTATYVAKHGETLVGVTHSGARLSLLRVGQTVEIEANCKGLSEQQLLLRSGRLRSVE